MWGLLEQAGVRIISSSLQSLRAFAPEALKGISSESWNAVQQRGLISVDVQGNKAEKALRTLKRRVLEEGFKDTWDAQKVFMKPTHERKIAAMETAKRLRKREFREKLRWIMRRNSRGFWKTFFLYMYACLKSKCKCKVLTKEWNQSWQNRKTYVGGTGPVINFYILYSRVG